MRAGILLYIVFLVFPSIGWAQKNDTLETVVIEAPRWSDQNNSIFILEATKENSVLSAVSNTSEALRSQFGVNLQSYGQSGLIAPRIRGTNPEHTALIWNGINVNHAGLGQTNGFNLPFLQTQNVQIAYGGGSVPFGSSAIAASILVNDEISFGEREELNISGTYGSFNSIQSQAGYKESNSNKSIGISIYRIQSENDFEYVNSSDFRRPTVRQNNAAFQQNGLQGSFAKRLGNNHQLRFHSWIHDGYTEVQPAMSNRKSEDSQEDHFHRYKLSHLYHSKAGILQTDVFYTSDDINFNGFYSGIKRYGLRSAFNKKLTQFFSSGIGVNYDYYVPDYSNYPEKSEEARLSLYSFNTVHFGKLKGRINLRYTAVRGYDVPLTPNISLTYRLLESGNKNLILKGSYSENFRLPTLNERFWTPGGNPDILPESSSQYEFGMEANSGIFNFKMSYFNMDIVNAVQWILKDSLWSENNQRLYTNVYSPENISQVHSEGLNAHMGMKNIEFGNFKLNSRLTYNYTMARDRERMGQRLYTPYHSLATFLGFSYRKFTLKGNYQFVSERKASSEVLDPYMLLNLSIGKKVELKNHRFEFSFQVNNTLDQTYQTFINRAMPGRNYSITINYNLDFHESD